MFVLVPLDDVICHPFHRRRRDDGGGDDDDVVDGGGGEVTVTEVGGSRVT